MAELAQHGCQLSAGAQNTGRLTAPPAAEREPQQPSGEPGISEAIAQLQRNMPGGNSAPPAGRLLVVSFSAGLPGSGAPLALLYNL